MDFLLSYLWPKTIFPFLFLPFGKPWDYLMERLDTGNRAPFFPLRRQKNIRNHNHRASGPPPEAFFHGRMP